MGRARTVGRWLLAGLLIVAGLGHFVSRQAFAAQVPPWLPFPDAIVIVSGVVELALAVCLLTLKGRRTQVGWVVAAFFVVVFPGNISQFITQSSAFGLDTEFARGTRLLLQPLLVVWALWCTGAWSAWRAGRKARHSAREQ